MLIFSPHNLNLCLDSQETRFLWNIFEAVQKTRSVCFIFSKTLLLVFLTLRKLWEENLGIQATVYLIEGDRLIWGLFNTGFTV